MTPGDTPQLQLAISFLNAGRLDDAAKLCAVVLSQQPNHPYALGVLATVCIKEKRHAQALDYIQRGLSSGSELPQLYVLKATAHDGLGAREEALSAAWRAVTLSPDVQNGYFQLASVLHPGEQYYEVLRRLQEFLKPRSYIEIGIESGASLALANPPTIAIGIDPRPQLQRSPKTTTKIMPVPSDDYFASRDVKADLEADTVDLAFIDGLHIFEQALRDFANIERFSGPGTVVAIHDCFPIDKLTAGRDRKTAFWTGDIWKVSLCLSEMRPDLEIWTIPTPPTGLCIVRGFKPGSTLLADRFDEMVAKYIDLDVDTTAERRTAMRTVPNRWPEIQAMLARPAAV